MKKLLVCVLTAAMLLAGCGGSTAPASGQDQQKEEAAEEAVEAVEETAEAEEEAAAEPEEGTETAAAEVDESELLPQAKVEEILADAETVAKRFGAFTSSSGLPEADEFNGGSLISYSKDIYTFSMPSTWKDEGDYIMIGSGLNDYAAVALDIEDLSEYGKVDDGMVEAILQAYEQMSPEEFGSFFNAQNMELSDFERTEILDGQKAVAASFEGEVMGMDVEGVMMVGVDVTNNRLIVVGIIQKLDGQKSHFNDFKTFVGTMTH